MLTTLSCETKLRNQARHFRPIEDLFSDAAADLPFFKTAYPTPKAANKQFPSEGISNRSSTRESDMLWKTRSAPATGVPAAPVPGALAALSVLSKAHTLLKSPSDAGQASGQC